MSITLMSLGTFALILMPLAVWFHFRHQRCLKFASRQIIFRLSDVLLMLNAFSSDFFCLHLLLPKWTEVICLENWKLFILFIQEKDDGGGRGRFKSHSTAPARISDREKKAPLKTWEHQLCLASCTTNLIILFLLSENIIQGCTFELWIQQYY